MFCVCVGSVRSLGRGCLSLHHTPYLACAACALYTTVSRSRQKVNYPSRQPFRIPLPASLLRGGCVSTAIGSSEFLPCFSSLVHTTWLGLGLGLGLGLSLESGLATPHPNLLISPHYLPQQHAVVVDAVRVDGRLQHETPLLLLLATTYYYYYYSHSLPLTTTYYHSLPLTTTYHYCSLLPLTIHDYFLPAGTCTRASACTWMVKGNGMGGLGGG